MARGQALGQVRVYQRGQARRRRARSSPRARSRARAWPAASAGTRRVPCTTCGVVLLIVTVTMNAAIDRTLTVPNFQRGQRHRASAGLTLAGGKGINIARALKRLGVPVVATGLAGGRTGTRIVEELTAEAILNDFVRIDDESRTSTAIVDPTGGSYTEVNEWGPHVSRRGAGDAAREARLPLAGRRLRRLLGLAPARDRRRLLRRGRARAEPPRRAAPCSTPRASRCASACRPSRCSSRRTSARPRRSSARSSTTTTTSSPASRRSPSSARATS